jgi:hypothetical protein
MARAVDTVLIPVRFGLALVANLLPRRYRLEWDGRLPLSATAGWSALATVFLAFAVGVPGLLRVAARAGSAGTDAMLETATKVNQGTEPLGKMGESYLVSMLTLPAFLFFTPLGLVTLYIGGTGLVRCLSFAAADPRGDPLFGAIDAAGRALAVRWRRERAESTRLRQEGREEPDIVATGPDADAPDAVRVLIASRRKPGWTEGAFVLDGETRFRIGRPFDRRYPSGLRTVYPLLEVAQAEVMRRIVRYAFPAPESAVETGPAASHASDG